MIMYRVGAVLIILLLLSAAPSSRAEHTNNPFTPEIVREAQKLVGLEFTEPEISSLVKELPEQLETFQRLRAAQLSNNAPPALWFSPLPVGFKFQTGKSKLELSPPKQTRRPANVGDLAFWPVRDLAELVRRKQITSEELTRFYLQRLKEYGPRLECVITVTEDLALAQARRADQEIAAGRYRGPLHGIPYAAKDLLSVRGVRTTWGAAPYTNQVFDVSATVIERLEKAGAVLIAKTTLGELAMGPVWFGGTTRNPWNLKQDSSGSSAGSAAATAAGLVPFAIGSETYGSIVSPCDRCGITGLRPTFGRVSRAGAMALSWSMDKLGPICRTVEDCAIVLNAIYGPDGLDQSVQDAPFRYEPRAQLRRVRLGFLRSDFESEKGERKENDLAVIEKLRALGAQLVPVTLPELPVSAISIVLSTEAAAAFDDLTLSGKDHWLKQQSQGSWPNIFRVHRFVPAVEYLQAQRVRYLLIQQTAKLFETVDVLLCPSTSGESLLLGNLTGNPCVVLPNGFTKDGTPTSICFLGRLFDEGRLLAVAKAYQDSTDFHLRHPPL